MALFFPLLVLGVTGGVLASSHAATASSGNKIVYLAAERVLWNYAPSEQDVCTGTTASEGWNQTMQNYDLGFGPQVYKAVFVKYTDASFTVQQAVLPEFEHLGLFGPVLYASPGDQFTVVFRNWLSFAVNAEPAGVLFDDNTPAQPNATVTYKWNVTEASCSNEAGFSSKLWLYTSTVDREAHTRAGLAGGVVCVSRDMADPATGQPTDVDREFFMLLQVYDETRSALLADNKALRTTTATDEEMQPVFFYTINGFILCNQKGVTANVGQKVRFHVMSLGSVDELHSFHWHGLTLMEGRQRTDVVLLQAGSGTAAETVVDNPGTWFIHCHVNAHFTGGMTTLFAVVGDQPTFQQGMGARRQYFLSVEEDDWNYTPSESNMCSGSPVPFTEDEEVFVKHSNGSDGGMPTVGSVYRKLRYIEYTDATFTTTKVRNASEAHLGILGPVIRGEVGDVITVTLRNSAPSLSCATIHPHGVRYTKESEGALYNDGTTGADKADDCVTLNTTHVYTWHVAEDSGPPSTGPSSMVWLYHGHHDEMADTYAGMMGAIVIVRKGSALPDGRPSDVDSEHVLLFHISNELYSAVWQHTVEAFLPRDVDFAALEEDEEFQESNLMHNINGYLYCNVPSVNFVLGSRSRVYLLALGSDLDMHTPYAAAASLTNNGFRLQAISIFPGGFTTVDFTPSVLGTGVIQCHVNDHTKAGMMAVYNVTAPTGDGGDLLSPPTAVKTYYLAAQIVSWDYLPSKRSMCGDNSSLNTNMVEALNTTFLKAVYRAYTDETFTMAVPHDPYLGILGPTLTVAVGEKLKIVLKNQLPFAAGFQASGGLQTASSNANGLTVEPNAVNSIEYYVDGDSGPGARDGSNVLYSYYSAADPIAHLHAGLVGALLVTSNATQVSTFATAAAAPPPLPSTNAHTVALLWSLLDEAQSPLFDTNWHAMVHQGHSHEGKAEEMPDELVFHSINGYQWCNGPVLEVPLNGTVRLLMVGMGSEADQHAPKFPGQELQRRGSSSTTVSMLPGLTAIAYLRATTMGEWVYHCSVLDHDADGEQALLNVTTFSTTMAPSPPPPGDNNASGLARARFLVLLAVLAVLLLLV